MSKKLRTKITGGNGYCVVEQKEGKTVAMPGVWKRQQERKKKRCNPWPTRKEEVPEVTGALLLAVLGHSHEKRLALFKIPNRRFPETRAP